MDDLDDMQFGEPRSAPATHIARPSCEEGLVLYRGTYRGTYWGNTRVSSVVNSLVNTLETKSVPTSTDSDENLLQLFIAIDALLKIWNHARSDTSIELGGVIVGSSGMAPSCSGKTSHSGNACELGEGRPIVNVVDVIPATEYEATRGSFRFTHATWSDIGNKLRRRNDGSRIVGWYHTHPGWGIFLSEMDRFICDHFFSGSQDLALVLDPIHERWGAFHRANAAGQTNNGNDREQSRMNAHVELWVYGEPHRDSEIQRAIEKWGVHGEDAC